MQIAVGSRTAVTVSPGSAIDALHEVVDAGAVPLGVRLGLEHDDVAAVDVVEVVAQLVDEHAVADLERRHHRLRRDVERLEQERLDDDRDDDRGDDRGSPTRSTVRLSWRFLAPRARSPRRRRRAGSVAPPIGPLPARLWCAPIGVR